MRTSKVFVLLVAATNWCGAVTAMYPQWGIELEFVTKVEPGGTIGPGIGGGVIVGPDRRHRFINDASQKRYFGYDLAVEPQGNSLFRVQIEPLSLTPRQLQGGNGTWQRISLPAYPNIPMVRVGDTLAIDLLVNSSTGQKIVDYITVRRMGFEGVLASGQSPRDFTLADVDLDFMQPRLTIDGKLVDASARGAGGVVGPVIWFYLAGKGRFVMTIVPNESLGFRKAGVVARNGLAFKDGEVSYRVDCKSRIVPGEGLYNLYVFHDPAWYPKGDSGSEFQTGAADRPEYLVHK